MAMKRCPVCGERYSDTYKTCPFCEEEEYWEDEQQEVVRRPGIREGVRGSSRGRSPYSIVTPILIVLIALMALLLVYLLYGDKIAEKFHKDPDEGGKADIATPVEPPVKPENKPAQDPNNPDGEDPEGSGAENPDDGSMPESGTTPGGTGTPSSGGMSYASAAALPGGLTLNNKDFSRSPAEGPYQLKVSGGTGTYTWISENPAIAAVASDGTVTPVANGTTNILVTDGSKKAVCIVRINGASSSAPSTPSTGTTTPASPSSGGTSSGGTSSGGTTSSGGGLKAGKAVVVNGGNGVRVRSGPGTSYDILASIPNGGSVNIVRKSDGDWYEITFSNVGGVTTTGYMKGEFLSNS